MEARGRGCVEAGNALWFVTPARRVAAGSPTAQLSRSWRHGRAGSKQWPHCCRCRGNWARGHHRLCLICAGRLLGSQEVSEILTPKELFTKAGWHEAFHS